MRLAPVVFILTLSLTPPSDAATTYNLALLQETLEVLGEDIVMFVTNKLNGGKNEELEIDDSLYETADEQPGDIEDDEDEDDDDQADDEEKTAEPGRGVEENGAERDDKGGEIQSEEEKDKDSTRGKDKAKEIHIGEVNEAVGTDNVSNEKTVDESKKRKTGVKRKKHVMEIKDEFENENNAEEPDGNEEDEPDMAESLASVAVNMAADKLKEQLGKISIQLK